MLIDNFINNREANISIKRGGNKKVYVFNDYVLLGGSFKEDEINQLIVITKNLQTKGISILPTLEYKIIYPENEYGYVRGYTLQPRAKGTEIYTYKMTPEEHQNRLKDIASMDSVKINKFISDWISIEQAGLLVDPSKTENFFYSDGGINFIDLNLKDPTLNTKPINLFTYICGILTDYQRNTTTEHELEYIVQIIKNVAICFVKRNLLETKDIMQIIPKSLPYEHKRNKALMCSISSLLMQTQQKKSQNPVEYITKSIKEQMS